MNGSRDGAMRQRRHPKLHFEVRLVPSQEGVPPGDANPYRSMDEAERETLLLQSFVRILRGSADAPSGRSVPDSPSA